MLFKNFSAITGLRLEIRKPKAVPAAAASFVRIERCREEI